MIDVNIVADKKMVEPTIKKIIKTINKATYDATRGLTLGLTEKIKYDKLRGQVLYQQSGKLQKSIKSKIIRDNEENEITGISYTNVKYAAVHEYGFKGNVTVKEHIRKIKKSGRKNRKSITVKEHVREANFPERSFMRKTLEELHPQIIYYMNVSIKSALEKEGFV